MDHPLVLGKKISVDAGNFYFEEIPAPGNQLIWTNKKQSAFSIQDGQSESERDELLESRDQNFAYKMLEEYEFTYTASIPTTQTPCICFKAPMDGRITLIRRWDDKVLIAYLPYDYSSWKFSSSIQETAFKRVHGNAWAFGKYNTRDEDASEPLNREDVLLVVKSILAAWLLSENPTPIYIIVDGIKLELLSSLTIDPFIALSETERRTRAWETVTPIADTYSEVLFLPESEIFLPIKGNSVVPILMIDAYSYALGVNPNLKMGVVDIPDIRIGDTSAQVNLQWTYYDTDTVLKNLVFTPNLFGAGGSSLDVNAWSPLETLSNNRILKIKHGGFTLVNPVQVITPTPLINIFSSSIFENGYDQLEVYSGNAGTSWSVRYLNNALQPLSEEDESFRNLGAGEMFELAPATNYDIGYLNIKAEYAGESYEIAIPKGGVFSGLRQHIVRILKEEFDFWQITHPGLREHHREALNRIIEYRLVGLELTRLLRICKREPRTRRLIEETEEIGEEINGDCEDMTCVQCWYWSAAFISYVMRQSGKDLGLDPSQLRSFFHYNATHTNYILWARRGRNHQEHSQIYWLYRISDEVDDEGLPLAIQPGDLLVKNGIRNGALTANTYDHITPHSHGDLVYEVFPDRVIVVGGNVEANVQKKTVFLDDQGLIDVNAIWQMGHSLEDPSYDPSHHNRRSQFQFFAIMKLRLSRLEH